MLVARKDRKRRRGPSHPLLEFRLLLQGHGVSLSDDRDDVHHFAEVFHELQIERAQAGAQRRRDVRATLPSPTQPRPPLQGHTWDRRTGLGTWLRLRGCSFSSLTHVQNRPRLPSTRTHLPPFSSNPARLQAPRKPLLLVLFLTWGFPSPGNRCGLSFPSMCLCVMVTHVYLVLPVG